MTEPELLITVGQLLRGPVGERVADAAVLVRDGTIVCAGPRAEVVARAPEAVTELAFPDATMLPGLIDAHVHLVFDGGRDPVGRLLDSDPDTVASDMALRAERLVRTGVTTVRDLGDRPPGAVWLRGEIDAGRVPGPRVLAAVSPLTPPNGHCWFFGGEVDGDRAMRDMVRRNADVGADVIKVMASGGHLTPGSAAMWEPQFSRRQLATIVAEAHGLGLPVAAHAHGTASIVDAVSAGVDTIEHCAWLVGEGRFERRDDVARDMARRGIAACNTAGPHDWRVQTELLGEPAARALFDRIVWLDELGVRVLPGSDGGVQNSVYGEFAGMLEMYEWLGFPPERVIELATTSAAAALGIDTVTGRIAAGMAADLLVVGGDPRAGTAVLHDVRLVLARGRCYPVS